LGERSLEGAPETSSREGLVGSDPSMDDIDILLSGRFTDVAFGRSREAGNEAIRFGPRDEVAWEICCACGVCGDEGGGISRALNDGGGGSGVSAILVDGLAGRSLMPQAPGKWSFGNREG
jgi:hypothetical protein